jgi:hypothetical protein
MKAINWKEIQKLVKNRKDHKNSNLPINLNA